MRLLACNGLWWTEGHTGVNPKGYTVQMCVLDTSDNPPFARPGPPSAPPTPRRVIESIQSNSFSFNHWRLSLTAHWSHCTTRRRTDGGLATSHGDIRSLLACGVSMVLCEKGHCGHSPCCLESA
jgi:hypothetical protein